MVAARPMATVSLLQALRKYRTDQAYVRAVPPSTVFSDKIITNIIKARPSTLVSLLKLRGVGSIRCQNYGRDIVRLVNLDTRTKGRRHNSRGKSKSVMAPKKTEVKRKRKSPKSKALIKLKNGHNAANAVHLSSKSKPSKRPTNRTFSNKQHLKLCNSNTLSLPGSCGALVVPQPLPSSQKTKVYVLELEDGRVYVGSSKDVTRRISQHTSGSGSAYTRLYRPTGVQLPRLGNIEGDGDAAERDETLRYMMIRGIPYVRGWKFSRVDMPPEEFDEAEANIRELFDLCRRCGYKGHFCTHCRATFDRLGNPVRR
jgi:predicted GIY-YIG superfamily endonuclease